MTVEASNQPQAPGCTAGRKGSNGRASTPPAAMMIANAASRSVVSDFRIAFQLACMIAASNRRPITRGSRTVEDEPDTAGQGKKGEFNARTARAQAEATG